MARKNTTKTAVETDGTTNTNEEAVVAENTEAVETVENTEAVEAPVESAEVVEAPIDLEPFKTAVAEALKTADGEDGSLPEASIASVNEVYRKIDGNKGKAEARKYLETEMLTAVSELRALDARAYGDLRSHLSAAGGTKAEKAPADPTAAYVQRFASLQIALNLVAEDAPQVEGLQDKINEALSGVTEQVSAYRDWTKLEVAEGEEKPEAPEVSPVVRAAFKLATGKASGTRAGTRASGGPRRDTGKHIASAFADKEVGTFLTVAEIAKHRSEEYGDDSPSQGAISARLSFDDPSKCTVAGIEPVEAKSIDGKNPKGARKVA